jgi:hypothetical protein
MIREIAAECGTSAKAFVNAVAVAKPPSASLLQRYGCTFATISIAERRTRRSLIQTAAFTSGLDAQGSPEPRRRARIEVLVDPNSRYARVVKRRSPVSATEKGAPRSPKRAALPTPAR